LLIDDYICASIKKDISNDFSRLVEEQKIDKEIIKSYEFTIEELNIINGITGGDYGANRNLSIDTMNLDHEISKIININCLCTGQTINGYIVGSESVLEILSYKYKMKIKSIYEHIIEHVGKLYITKEKYRNDLLHKLILKVLGIETICTYSELEVSLEELVNRIRFDYPVLFDYFNVTSMTIGKVISDHHYQSFYSTPLLTHNNNNVTVCKL